MTFRSVTINSKRQYRLRRRSDFNRVFSLGQRIHTRHVVLHYLLLDHELARFGLVVSRKVGNAVVRNKVKRWLREAVWHAEEAMPPVDLVLRARPSAAQSEFDEIAQDIRAGMRKIGAPQ